MNLTEINIGNTTEKKVGHSTSSQYTKGAETPSTTVARTEEPRQLLMKTTSKCSPRRALQQSELQRLLILTRM